MKKLSILLLSVFISSSFSLNAQSFSGNTQMTSDREIPLKGSIIDDGPSTRSIVIQPVQAYQSAKVVTIFFNEPMSSVSISVIKASTGEIVYTEMITHPTSFDIDLSTSDAGEYKLEIASAETYLTGNFIL